MRAFRVLCKSPYLILFVVSDLCVVAVETVLLNVKYDYFRGGFLANAVLYTAALRILFLLSSFVLDAALILALWTLLVSLLSRLLRLSNFVLLPVLLLAAGAVPFTCDYINYELSSYLSNVIDLGLIWELSGHSPQELITQWRSQLTSFATIVLPGFLILISILLVWHRNRIGKSFFFRSSPPRLRTLLAWTGMSATVGAIILITTTLLDSPLAFGLTHKPSGIALRKIIEYITDVDRDGYGFMSKPRDPAPFDASIYPYAIDIPGNGIDENGVGGDHPADYHPSIKSPDETSPWTHTTNTLLILLESVRADTLDRMVNGREVTPFMRRLASEGAQSKLAYTHCGYTAPSRAQLFGGRMLPYPGQTTLIDDFKKHGYYVAYFSGQDDSFGESGPLVGYDRADKFYDARSDKDKRYTQFSTPASLAVPCKLVNRRVLSFLDSYDPKHPLFLYVNYHDTHFPYHHRELDNILGVTPLPRERIKPGASAAIWETYANAAANVDRSIAELVQAWRKKLEGRPLALIIVSDHGESLFENGFLGHGYSVEDSQTRIPFIVWGDAGTWYEPLGLADIRPQLLRNLSEAGSGAGGRPRVIADPTRIVLQHIGTLNTPRLLAWRTMEDLTVYDFWNDRTIRSRIGVPHSEKIQSGLPSSLFRFIWDWESMVSEQPSLAPTPTRNGSKSYSPQ